MKAKTSIVLAIALVLFSIGITSMVYTNYMLVDKMKVPMDVEVTHEKAIGINVDNDALHFGKVQNGGASKRYITLANNDNFDMEVSIASKGDIPPSWVFLENTSMTFILDKNSTMSLTVGLNIPYNTPEGNYTGDLIVIFRRA